MSRIQAIIILVTSLLFSCSKEVNENFNGSTLEVPAEAVHALESEQDLDVLINEIGDKLPSVLPERYDAFLFIDKTEALHPLER